MLKGPARHCSKKLQRKPCGRKLPMGSRPRPLRVPVRDARAASGRRLTPDMQEPHPLAAYAHDTWYQGSMSLSGLQAPASSAQWPWGGCTLPERNHACMHAHAPRPPAPENLNKVLPTWTLNRRPLKPRASRQSSGTASGPASEHYHKAGCPGPLLARRKTSAHYSVSRRAAAA